MQAPARDTMVAGVSVPTTEHSWNRPHASSEPSSPRAIILAIALAHLLLHVVTNGNYGIFRDELYYLDCARHPAWGYVDHPPLSIWLLALARALFGDSVHAIRFFSELAGAVLIFVAALLAKEFGGGRFAQIVSALATAAAPAFMVETGFYSMNAFDLLIWAILAWIVARIANSGHARGWLWFGVVAGVGLLNKISVLFLGFALTIALVFTPLRRHFARWELYAGGAIAALLFLPYVLWNAAYGWPTLEFMDHARHFKIAAFTPAEFLGEQIMGMNPILAPLWIAGLAWLLLSKAGGRFRVLGLTYLGVLLLLMAQRAKPYYVFPAYAMLLAAGGCMTDAWFRRWNSAWPKGLVVAWIGLGWAVTLPLALPVFSPEAFLRYQVALGMKPKAAERIRQAEMPQYFADRFGWENLTSVVGSVYAALPPEEREQCVIIGSNYGEAGAIHYFGPRHNLPKAYSVHNNHYFWGPPPFEPRVVIHLGGSRESLGRFFGDVRVAATVESKYAMPYETNLPIFICRGMTMPWKEAWRVSKRFI